MHSDLGLCDGIQQMVDFGSRVEEAREGQIAAEAMVNIGEGTRERPRKRTRLSRNAKTTAL